MKKIVAVLVAALVGAAFVGGYWPQRQARGELEGRVKGLEERIKALEKELSEAQARVRMAGILGHMLTLIDVVAEKNYGHARTMGSAFFDAVRAESDRASVPGFKEVLEGILANRDAVTAGLTEGDPRVLDLLRKGEARLRQALGGPQVAPPPLAPGTTASGAAPSPPAAATAAPASPTPAPTTPTPAPSPASPVPSPSPGH
jgi:cell division septation protein DedD